jgi:hypothetical protein
MTAPNSNFFAAGLNAGRIYQLSGDYPTGGTDTVPYDGLNIGGPINFTMTVGDPGNVTHPGNNTVLQQDTFPTTDPTTATLTMSRHDTATVAILTGIKVATVGDIKMLGWQTDKAGTEPTVAGIFYSQAKDPSGNRVWHTRVIPRMVAVPKSGNMASRERAEVTYNITPQNGTQHLTGVDFTVAQDGYTSAQYVDLISNHRVHFAQWTAAAAQTVFTLDTDLPAYAAGVIKVSVNGAAYLTEGAGAGNVVSTTTGFTLGSALTGGEIVVAMYEIDDTANHLLD